VSVFPHCFPTSSSAASSAAEPNRPLSHPIDCHILEMETGGAAQ